MLLELPKNKNLMLLDLPVTTAGQYQYIYDKNSRSINHSRTGTNLAFSNDQTLVILKTAIALLIVLLVLL